MASKKGNLIIGSANRISGLQELASLQHPVAPGMQQQVGCPLLPPLSCWAMARALRWAASLATRPVSNSSLLQATEQQVRQQADRADGQLPAQVRKVEGHRPLGLLQAWLWHWY